MIIRTLGNVVPQRAKPWTRALRKRLGGSRSPRFAAPPLREHELRAFLRDVVNPSEAPVLFVHSAAATMNLGFSPLRVLELLREAVGPNGTLLFPSTHHHGRAAAHLRTGTVFDVRRSPTTMGLIAEVARRQTDAVRSLHPTNAVVAIGKHADELTRDHPKSEYPSGAVSPYYQIVHHGGQIAGLGVDCERLSFVHCVEDILQDRFPVETREATVYAGRVRGYDGAEFAVKTLAAHARIRWRNMKRYFRSHISREAYHERVLSGATFFVADSNRLYKEMEDLAHRGITMYPRFIYRSSPIARWT